MQNSTTQASAIPGYGWCPPKFKWFKRPDHAPFREFAIHRLALGTINLSTKFKVIISTHYKDIKYNKNSENGVV